VKSELVAQYDASRACLVIALSAGHKNIKAQSGVRIAAAAAHPMQICVSTIAMLLVCFGHIVVEHHIDSLNVNATPNQICGHKQPLGALLEGAAAGGNQLRLMSDIGTNGHRKLQLCSNHVLTTC